MRLPELPQLEAFLAVASTLHFGTAAQQLYVTQSTVSHRIRQLEDAVGVELFDRSRRRVTLTDAGRAYERRVRGLIGDLRLAGHDAGSAARGELGRLAIGYSGATVGTPLLDGVAAMARAAPRVRIELRQTGAQEQVQRLLSAELDLGCTFLPLPPYVGGLSTHTLAPMPVFVWVVESHPLAGVDAVALTDLQGERSIMLSDRAEAGFSSFARTQGFPCSAAPLEVDSLDACIGLIRRGAGVAVLPHTDLAPADLRAVPLRERLEGQCHLLWNDETDNRALRPLLERLGVTSSTL